MLRIDEIYNNTFWPWLQKNFPGVRMFMCNPFGRSDADSVINFGSETIKEHNYIFFFDQEPIHLNIHDATFDQVIVKNYDLRKAKGAICTSERDSDTVEKVVTKYGWSSHYYFFHGWAALDWYRGYDKTFLITPAVGRNPTKTFLAPNRIIAGARQHRLEMLYHIFKQNMLNNYVSCPQICPAENITINKAAEPLLELYPDIQQVFANQPLPLNFAGETDHPMHSCWLSLFDQAADSLLYLVTETVASGRRHHLTEKTFKPIALGMPFVLVATQGSLAYLRSYGFKTFDHVWDESYDQISDDHQRIQAIADLLGKLNTMTVSQRQAVYQACLDTVEHNWNHFYHGGFETVLWSELQAMLNGIAF